MRGRCFFFFNDTATTEIYTLSLHDALPILEDLAMALFLPLLAVALAGGGPTTAVAGIALAAGAVGLALLAAPRQGHRLGSEEHTSEIQSRQYIVCRPLLEKKKKAPNQYIHENDGIIR